MSKIRTFLVVAILALATFGVASMFWKSKPKDTAIDERIFRLTLPGHWSRQPPSDATRWTYRSDTGRDQLTISLLSSTNRMSAHEQLATLQRVTELRRRAETDTPGVSGVAMTAATFAESGGVQTARFGGIESGTQRRFSCLLLCSSSGYRPDRAGVQCESESDPQLGGSFRMRVIVAMLPCSAPQPGHYCPVVSTTLKRARPLSMRS
jgi:hypothetical protein